MTTSNETNDIIHQEQIKLLLSELKQLSFNKQLSSQHEQLINQLQDELKRQLNEIVNSPQRQNKSYLITKINQIARITQTLKNNIQQQVNTPQSTIVNNINSFSNSDEIYIDNAGLILLWPFLNRFFTKLKLIENNKFIDSISTERAILLLQYLVDISTEIPEHILPLNKILCGVDLFEPIANYLELTTQYKTECENLLAAVIQNWSILKNTSIEGFRKAFLQRNGILRVRDNGWLLQVERESYDILLDKIPWSLRVVKLPWMVNILYVEW